MVIYEMLRELSRNTVCGDALLKEKKRKVENKARKSEFINSYRIYLSRRRDCEVWAITVLPDLYLDFQDTFPLFYTQ